MKKEERKPATAARVLAFAISVLLAGTVLLLCLLVTADRLTSSETLYLNIASDPEILDAETEQIRGRIGLLAEKYAFDAEQMASLFDRDTVAEFGSRAVEWWTGILTKGTVQEVPSVDLTEAEALLDGDGRFSEGLRAREIKDKKKLALEEIGKAVTDTVIPVRTLVINGVARKILNKVPLKKLLETGRSLTLPLLAAAFFLSGLLALTLSRKLRYSLLYCGGSFGAAGLMVIAAIALVLILNVRGMIGEISGLLTKQYVAVERKVLLQAGATALLLLGAGAAGLILGNRGSAAEGKA